MFDYFNSARKANQILARIAKKAFNSEETKPIVECNENSGSLDSGKIVLKLSKLDSTMWKVSALKTENSGEKVIISDDIFNPSAQKCKEKLSKKRKLGGKNLQFEEGRAETPCKKRRVLVKKIKKRDVSDIDSKNSIRRSKRLATKSEKNQNIEYSAVTNLYCSAIVSQPLKGKKSTKDQSYLKADSHKPRQYQNLRSSSNVPS